MMGDAAHQELGEGPGYGASLGEASCTGRSGFPQPSPPPLLQAHSPVQAPTCQLCCVLRDVLKWD